MINDHKESVLSTVLDPINNSSLQVAVSSLISQIESKPVVLKILAMYI